MTARVVVADDDGDYRLLVRLALDPDTRFSVVGEAPEGNELVEKVVATGADLALVGCDMGDGETFDALPRLRSSAPGCRVVLVSGYGEDELRRAARAAGAVGYLRKDTPPSRLADELAALAALVEIVADVLDAAANQFDAHLRSAREARSFVSSALDSWGLGEVAEIVNLLVSELVTNAVVHARSDVDVVVQLTPQAARVEVSDQSDIQPAVKDAAMEDESGRGLAIVDSLSSAWGVRPRAGGGKTVWFEVARPGTLRRAEA